MPIASARIIQKGLRWDESDYDGIASVSIDVDIGYQVTLARGFVNAKRRHASALPWYQLGSPKRTHPPMTVRIPAVATCRCGGDVLLRAPQSAEAYAASDRESLTELVREETAAEAGDRYTQWDREAGR
jgi:hypothetical protein